MNATHPPLAGMAHARNEHETGLPDGRQGWKASSLPIELVLKPSLSNSPKNPLISSQESPKNENPQYPL